MNTASRILISGASGLIGSALVRAFTANQISVVQLVRKQNPASQDVISWSPQSSPAIVDPSALEGFDVVIHLSGANIAGHRWTAAYKKEIVDSRVQTTNVLTTMLAQLKRPPRAFLCASATGFYGNRGDEVLTESSAPGAGFLAESCVAWETATQPAKAAGIRVANLRFGVVLSGEGGALTKMLPIFRLGLAGRLGSGNQWMSWISLSDTVSAITHIIDTPQLVGPINMVAPNPVTNAEFTRAMGQAVHRPTLLPAPAFALRAVVGEMADETLLASARVLPEQLTQSGFRFEQPQIAPALESMLAKSV